MFSTKGQEVKSGGGKSKSLQPGVVYAHIYDAQVKTNKNGDKKVLELVLETTEAEGFEGWPIYKNDPEGPKFKGLSGRVTATLWTDQFRDTTVKNEIIHRLITIAIELGLRDEVDEVQASSLEEWVAGVLNILKGIDAYWFIKGSEEEYNGKTIVRLSLPKYKFCSLDETKMDKFDKNNAFHYKALQNKPVASFEPVNDDFDL